MKCRGLNLTFMLTLLALVRCSYQVRYEAINRSPSIYRENPAMSQQAQSQADTRFDEQVSNYIAEHVLGFAHKLGQLLEQQTLKAEVFSPVSIISALALLMLGAKGRSYHELKQVFGIDKNQELVYTPSKFHIELGKMLEDVQLHDRQSKRARSNANWRESLSTGYNIRQNSGKQPRMEHITRIANGLFSQQGYSINPDYKSILETVYKTLLESVDFTNQPEQARDYINQWVSRNTYGKIPHIISGSIPQDANIILANALYFKGFWEEPFIKGATVTDNFYPDGKQQQPVEVQMMGTAGVFPFYDAAEYGCRIIGLPYQDNVTTMYVIQPYQSDRLKLKLLQQTLDAQKIEDLISQMTKKSAIIAFPKMHLVRSINLKDLLTQLGVQDIFTRGNSDLSLIGVGKLAQSQPARSGYPSQSATQPTARESYATQFSPSQTQQYDLTQSVTQPGAQGPPATQFHTIQRNQYDMTQTATPPATQRIPATQYNTMQPNQYDQTQSVARPATQFYSTQMQQQDSTQNAASPAAQRTPATQFYTTQLQQHDSTQSATPPASQRTPATQFNTPQVNQYMAQPAQEAQFSPSQTQQFTQPQSIEQQSTLATHLYPIQTLQFSPSLSMEQSAPQQPSAIKGFRKSESSKSYTERVLWPNPSRSKRQTESQSAAIPDQHLYNLELERVTKTHEPSDLYVQDILHQVDIAMNERGTEAAAATATLLTRTGPDVLFRVEEPFMFLIRHDPTKLVLFYGIVNEPEL